MPIEIRELVIRATVDLSGTAGGRHGSKRSKAHTHAPAHSRTGGEDDIVQSCVREVLRILEDKRER
jgi:Family of unknown function (DUF5908)